MPAGSALEPLATLPPQAPDDFDRSTRTLAAAVLLGDRERAAVAAERIDALDAERRTAKRAALGPRAVRAGRRNATLSDSLTFRAAQRELLDRSDLEPALERRVQIEVDDDPLALADQRLFEARQSRVTRAVNAVTSSVGTSFANPVLLIYRFTMSMLGLGLAEHREDELTPPERQALGHWKTYVERHPDSREAAALLDEIEEAQLRWLETQRHRNVRRARRALDADQPAAARALRGARAPLRARGSGRRPAAERGGAAARPRLGEPAAQRRGARRRARSRAGSGRSRSRCSGRAATSRAPRARSPRPSRSADPGGEPGPMPRSPTKPRSRARWRRRSAGANARAGIELEEIADADVARSNMARHAIALVYSPDQNPYRAFHVANRQITGHDWEELALGSLADGVPDHDLPWTLSWLGLVPALPGVVIGLPARLIQFPFQHPDRRVPAVLARRYLERFPEGEEAGDLRGWLLGFEQGRGNHVGALRVAESGPAPDPKRIAKLREEAAAQALASAEKERRLEVRVPLLQEVASQFPGTTGAHEAGVAVREEIDRASAQRIRISKGYLLENPSVAGRSGLALRPDLLDGELENGELHSQGVTLIGGGMIELAFVGAKGRAGDGARAAARARVGGAPRAPRRAARRSQRAPRAHGSRPALRARRAPRPLLRARPARRRRGHRPAPAGPLELRVHRPARALRRGARARVDPAGRDRAPGQLHRLQPRRLPPLPPPEADPGPDPLPLRSGERGRSSRSQIVGIATT